MKRRGLITRAGLAGILAAGAAPAVHAQPAIRWRLASSFPKALDTLRRYPGLFDGTRVRQASTFSEFDDLVTAPLHGFASARHYWQSASSKPRLAQIKRPTLVLNARNDPFLPAEALPNPADVGPSITLECPAAGGHVGFVTGPFPGQIDWLPQHILAFFQAQLAATPTT